LKLNGLHGVISQKMILFKKITIFWDVTCIMVDSINVSEESASFILRVEEALLP
jgi:hypothetical protein